MNWILCKNYVFLQDFIVKRSSTWVSDNEIYFLLPVSGELDVCEPNNNTVAEGKEFVSQASLSSLKTLLDLGFTINVDEK